MSLALNCLLTGEKVVHKQQIRPALVNKALEQFTKIGNEWKNLSQQSDSMFPFSLEDRQKV